MAKIGVMLVEDQGMVRGALASLLNAEPNIEVLQQAANGREALAMAREMAPDVLVTDIEMPEMTGLELARAIKEAGIKTRIVMLTTFARAGYLRRAMESGVLGYLLKDRPAAELAEAVRRVHRGLRVIDPDLAAEAWGSEEDPLTERERQILLRAGEGRTTAEVARELNLSEGTVRNYLS